MNTPFYDIAIGSDGDLDLSSGDLVFKFSDPQNLDDMLESYPGEWKSSLQTGIGLSSFTNSSQASRLLADAKLQFTADGFRGSPIVTFNNSILQISTSPITR